MYATSLLGVRKRRKSPNKKCTPNAPQTDQNPNPKSSCCSPAFSIPSHLICSARRVSKGRDPVCCNILSAGEGMRNTRMLAERGTCAVMKGSCCKLGRKRTVFLCCVWPFRWVRSKMAVESPCYGIRYSMSGGKISCLRNHHSSSPQSAFKVLI